MARPMQYDSESVTSGATALFWRRGFGNTSVDQLVRETGLNRHSLYRRFGGKDGLFAAALRYYRENHSRRYLACLTANRGLDALKCYFSAITDSRDPRGCLIANALFEPDLPGESCQIIDHYYAELEQALSRALAEGLEDGDLRPSLIPGPTARWLVAMVQGLSIQARQRGARTLEPPALDPVALDPLALDSLALDPGALIAMLSAPALPPPAIGAATLR